MPQIFSDLIDNFPESDIVKASNNIIGFSYPNKAEVTIIVSKSGGRYRIQSPYYEALLFIAHQMEIRLNEYFKYQIKFYIEDEFNFSDFFNLVENHFAALNKKKAYNSQLEKYTSMYTIVQKSLLNKFKEKNPPKLNNLDFLHKNIYKSINKISDDMLLANQEVKSISQEIIIWIDILLYKLKLR